MRLIERWTVAKHIAEPHLNEDARCVRDERAFAVSDGASESFAPRKWARILAVRFVRCPDINADWVREAIAVYHDGFDRNSMPWSAQAAFDRGSFATLLGLRMDAAGVSITAIGDSLAVLVKDDEIKASFPYEHPEQFRANPLLLSTVWDRNASVLDAMPATHWALSPGVQLFCMTDAIGAWLLADRSERLRQLRGVQSREQFELLVERAREAGLMRRDDTTLMVLG